MSPRTIFTAVIALMLVAFAGFACGGDDDDGGNGNGAAPTEALANGDDGNGDDGDDSDDGSDDGNGESDGGDAPNIGFSAGQGGSGTITVGDESFPYEVLICILEDDGGASATGYGELPDGTPYIANIDREGFGSEIITAGVDVGSDHISDRGDPEWRADEIIDPAVEENGQLSFRFDALWRDRESDDSTQVEGSAEVTCTP